MKRLRNISYTIALLCCLFSIYTSICRMKLNAMYREATSTTYTAVAAFKFKGDAVLAKQLLDKSDSILIAADKFHDSYLFFLNTSK